MKWMVAILAALTLAACQEPGPEVMWDKAKLEKDAKFNEAARQTYDDLLRDVYEGEGAETPAKAPAIAQEPAEQDKPYLYAGMSVTDVERKLTEYKKVGQIDNLARYEFQHGDDVLAATFRDGELDSWEWRYNDTIHSGSKPRFRYRSNVSMPDAQKQIVAPSSLMKDQIHRDLDRRRTNYELQRQRNIVEGIEAGRRNRYDIYIHRHGY